MRRFCNTLLPMATFTVRLPDDLATRFDAVAANVGGRSQALRAMIERVSVASQTPGSTPAIRSRGSNRITVRLSDDELSQLDEAAAERGVKRTDWIAAVIRSRLPLTVPPRDDLEKLIDIRRELRAIGRNVNQAVHALHAANMPESGLDVRREAERVTAMRDAVLEQITAIGEALKGDLGYWRGKALKAPNVSDG